MSKYLINHNTVSEILKMNFVEAVARLNSVQLVINSVAFSSGYCELKVTARFARILRNLFHNLSGTDGSGGQRVI